VVFWVGKFFTITALGSVSNVIVLEEVETGHLFRQYVVRMPGVSLYCQYVVRMPGISRYCIIREVAVNLHAREPYLHAGAVCVSRALYFYVICIALVMAALFLVTYLKT
jgi:hypothetical protein